MLGYNFNKDLQVLERVKIQMKGDYLKKPVTHRKMQTVNHQDFVVHTCQMQGISVLYPGWRKHMEDAKVLVQLQDGIHLFGVFDGHGGPQVAHYAAKMLPRQILNQPYFKLRNYSKALTNVFKRIDDLLYSERGQIYLQEISKKLRYSSSCRQELISHRAGCTANVVLMTADKYYVANIGDSRAVLSRNHTAVALSFDHKPENQEERNRIENAGGYIANGRVNGCLNLSRAFGDFDHKQITKKMHYQQPIISVPEIIEVERTKEDSFILIACDGVWERYVHSNQKMVDKLQQSNQKFKDKRKSLQKLIESMTAKDLKDAHGWDNMTAILIDFA